MNQQTLSLSAWISLLSLATIWGGSFLAYSLILREVPVFTLVANRVFWASLTLWIVVLLMKLPLPSLRQCRDLHSFRTRRASDDHSEAAREE